MIPNGLIDGRQLKTLLIDLKTKALDNERRSSGFTKAVMTAQIQAFDALLIFLNSNMTEENMTALKLTLDETPVPLKKVKAESGQNPELTDAIVEYAMKVKRAYEEQPESERESLTMPLNNLNKLGLKMTSVASKMWSLRERGILPKQIVPVQQKGGLKIAMLTPQDLAEREAKLAKRKQTAK